jgi:hypothetical protein
VGWDLGYVLAWTLLCHDKNLSFCFPFAAVFLCTTFPMCTIISWFLQGVSWTGRRRLCFLRCLALIYFLMFNHNQSTHTHMKGELNYSVYIITAFLMWKRVATTQKCHLKYQGKNGVKGPRLFLLSLIFDFIVPNLIGVRSNRTCPLSIYIFFTYSRVFYLLHNWNILVRRNWRF